MSTHATAVTASQPHTDIAEARRAAAAAFFGGTLEYYDLYIYASAAALVFKEIFFPAIGAAGTLAALATFAVAYVARPLGAIILGHLADRFGRKRALLITLLAMGLSTVLIGFLPDYETAGVAAPILLVILRICQGLSAGGETATASSLTAEVAPFGKRATYTVWAPNGIVAGFLLASIVFVGVAMLPEDQLLSWGWRVPFWASIAVVAIGYVIRRRLDEPSAFREASVEQQLAKVPLVETFRTHWASVLRVTLCSLAFAVSTVIGVFGLAYAKDGGFSGSTMLWVSVIANAVGLVFQPFIAVVCDKVGRKPIFVTGCIGSAVLIFAYFSAISSGNIILVTLVASALIGVTYGAVNAIYPAFFTEMFSLRVRTTGMAVGLQVGLIVSGFSPAIAQMLVGDEHSNWMPVAVMSAVMSLIAAVAGLSARETYRTPLDQLGNPDVPPPGDSAGQP
ncbi:MFS transporter [Mycolicibacterium mageritense]|uniref:Fosfomycin resistance protein AbaF n=1 Tax=Mycolicibacterium mageritense TaxID=53462 RepID=A0AAI8TQ97_MYCME|nr:MFS transporter [Mycolicibacterium mageritense]MBN3454971.1 MFS transporter [Mycobacterium sp. DSM 3803]MCC9180654.1 MFS transporter [Mycolicibacterium mageritense]TXI61332.1 MAG: MFS transporter [Mycolicibacterium mageritense]CDO23053.1 major facilitator superfamily protein [Mycolicibacterium mageritense DSM 44476 = CIP 104973]BBX32405.1 MFS transporter [Mycolicibacterium mageritense]